MEMLMGAGSATKEQADPEMDPAKVKRIEQRMKRLQKEREVRCAVDLVKRLEPFVSGKETKPEFEVKVREEGTHEGVCV